jgi:hypothetical protein
MTRIKGVSRSAYSQADDNRSQFNGSSNSQRSDWLNADARKKRKLLKEGQSQGSNKMILQDMKLDTLSDRTIGEAKEEHEIDWNEQSFEHSGQSLR